MILDESFEIDRVALSSKILKSFSLVPNVAPFQLTSTSLFTLACMVFMLRSS